MALKCRCICGCKLLVSSGSAGKRIKCPKCGRKLRVPSDVVEKRRAQLEARKSDSTSVPRRSKIEKPLSSLLDLSDPDPPPVQANANEPAAATSETSLPTASSTGSVDIESPHDESSAKVDVPQKPPPLPKRNEARASAALATPERMNRPDLIESEVVPELLPAAGSSDIARLPGTADQAIGDPPKLEVNRFELPVRGYEADRTKVATVRWLAAAVLLTGFVGVIPAMIDVVEYSLSPSTHGLSRWACALLLVGVLHCAYAVYLVQLPDWSSVWIVTFFTLAVAASYAAMFGLTLLSSDQGHFVQVLDLADRLRGGKATGWCLIMLSLMSLTSYFSGRVGSRWRSTLVA